MCDYQSDSIQKLNLHMTVHHGWLSAAHYLPFEETCPVCLKYFHKPIRVFEHLQYKSRKCFLNLSLRGIFLSCDQAKARMHSFRSEANAHVRAGRKRSHATLPVSQALGPKLPIMPRG